MILRIVERDHGTAFPAILMSLLCKSMYSIAVRILVVAYEINRAKDPTSTIGSTATVIAILVNMYSCYALSGVSISQYSGGVAAVCISSNC